MIKQRHLILIVILTFCISCSEDNDITTPRNLQEYKLIFSNDNVKEAGVIACAANPSGSSSTTYIFYYPVDGATDIRYYEADSLNIDETDFTNYRKQNLTSTDVFGGKLEYFSRSGSDEIWSIVTYVLEGKLHISNPICHKNINSQTIYKDKIEDEITVTNAASLMPTFSWDDFGIDDNDIYFHVLADEDNNFISGIYTRQQTYTHYDTSSTDQNLVVNTETPDDLQLNTTYNFTIMAVSEDNWVNLVIEDSFVTE